MAEPEKSEVIETSADPQESHREIVAYGAAKAAENGEFLRRGILIQTFTLESE
ncbi:hypothetical protein [Microterricola pindariensis]|uniref:hypothetical protein n=1 Tax=Microterricola pindariensis TaxID=478010 RepID=UPI001374B078|nr:hypothetical protein [Microterricola pindariensis]